MPSSSESVESLVATLAKFKPGAPLKNFITHARFPKFKNMEPGARIDFAFPFTALVGANGSGKSSVLHALWGMPYGYSTSRFWFATELDPILQSQKDPQRYVYGHWNESFGGVVETRKARLGAKRDYWEPYRASQDDGMLPVPEGDFEGKAKDRWNPVRRSVTYINFKATFGSFDRYFYFTDAGGEAEKRAAMLNEAKRLKRIVDEERQTYCLGGGRNRVFENRPLTAEELECASAILGRTYEAARIVRHSLYPGNRGEDLSVVFRRGLKYSEAFAGSGEVAVVTAVVSLLAAENFSLILLDEPETSLHPGAQRALLAFLLSQIKLRKHQVVVSTHSVEFLDGLPPEAVKVFDESAGGRVTVLERCSPYVALRRLGKRPPSKKRVLLEDQAAELLVRRAAEGLDPGEAQAFEFIVAPGGADALLAHYIPSAMTSNDDVYVLLDGDKRKVPSFTAPGDVPPSNYPSLGNILKSEVGCEPRLLIPGGNAEAHNEAKWKEQLRYLTWISRRLSYLPQACPEVTLLDASGASVMLNASSDEIKSQLRDLLTGGVSLNADELTGVMKVRTAKVPLDHPDLASIRATLQSWLV